MLKKIVRIVVTIGSLQVCLLAADFKLGVENITDSFFRKMSKKLGRPVRVALMTNQTGKTRKGISTCDVLLAKGADVLYLLASEHGIDGTMGAEKIVADSVDHERNIPIVSLFGGSGKHIGYRKISQHIMKTVDAFVVDIQDVGMRHFTHTAVMVNLMKCAARHNKKVIILDRPNPLGGYVEGPLVDEKYHTYLVSHLNIPLRHGLTIGELARYANTAILKKPVQLEVIPMVGYNRHKIDGSWFSHPVSPGLPELKSVYGYSFLGLLGDVRPFNFRCSNDKKYQCVSVHETRVEDDIFWQKLSGILDHHGLQHYAYRYCAERTKRCYRGYILELPNPYFESFMLMIDILLLAKQYVHNVDMTRSFDMAVGSEMVRKYLEGKIARDVLVSFINKGLDEFYYKAQQSFLYKPYPSVRHIR